MFLRLPRWLSPAVRFRSAGIANTYTPPRFRPSLQPMEDRLCPATWTGADLVNPNDAGDPDNWDTGEVPGTGLDLVAQFDGTSSSLQGSFTGNFTGSNLVYDPGPPAKEYTPGTLGMPPYAVTLNI